MLLDIGFFIKKHYQKFLIINYVIIKKTKHIKVINLAIPGNNSLGLDTFKIWVHSFDGHLIAQGHALIANTNIDLIKNNLNEK